MSKNNQIADPMDGKTPEHKENGNELPEHCIKCVLPVCAENCIPCELEAVDDEQLMDGEILRAQIEGREDWGTPCASPEKLRCRELYFRNGLDGCKECHAIDEEKESMENYPENW